MDTYDVVVVGAGTAGCVLAARLPEHAGTEVLLIEAGSDEAQPAMAEPPKWPALHTTPAGWAGLPTSVTTHRAPAV